MVQLDTHPTRHQEAGDLTLALSGNILSCRLIMKFSTVILFLLLIQEGQLSVSGERMGTSLINNLED